MVELRGISHRAGGVEILRDVSVVFQPNRFNVILGPNGAGKSTLLRVAAGLLAPSSGVVTYGERPIAEMDRQALARIRAVLSQNVELAFPLAVEDVVLMGRYPHYGRTPTARDQTIVNRTLELVDLTDKRLQPYPTLSGGERQKTQLARVLAQIWSDAEAAGPKCLLLDEPTSNLDVHYQIHILDAARNLLRGDCTVIAILHDLNAALHYGDAFFVLQEGRLVATPHSAAQIDAALLEQVFKVQARRLLDPDSGRTFWRFTR